jgi:phospholipid/cholesterol/gamma-HCH transport system substrate-binding protein
MKKTTGNKLRLGIFVSIAITLFIAGIYFIGQRQQLFSTTFHISGIFKDISGLQVGNNVRFSGINVGTIENIQQITDSTVRVDMMIDEHSRKFIKKSAKAIIGSDGLMGNKIVLIISGTGNNAVIVDNDIIETIRPVTMDDILLKIKVTSDNAENITDNLAAIMKNIREGKGTIGKLFMDNEFAQNIDETVVNIKQGTGGFKQNMDAAKHNFLLKGYFNKKEKEAKMLKQNADDKKEAEQKIKDKNKKAADKQK